MSLKKPAKLCSVKLTVCCSTKPGNLCFIANWSTLSQYCSLSWFSCFMSCYNRTNNAGLRSYKDYLLVGHDFICKHWKYRLRLYVLEIMAVSLQTQYRNANEHLFQSHCIYVEHDGSCCSSVTALLANPGQPVNNSHILTNMESLTPAKEAFLIMLMLTMYNQTGLDGIFFFWWINSHPVVCITP